MDEEAEHGYDHRWVGKDTSFSFGFFPGNQKQGNTTIGVLSLQVSETDRL